MYYPDRSFIARLKEDAGKHLRIFISGKGMDGKIKEIGLDYIVLEKTNKKTLVMKIDRIDDYELDDPRLKDI